MSDVAQTNLQLLNQLRSLDWPEHDLTSVRRAYDLASRVFSGQYRASGKPFVTHLIGTASIVVGLDERPPLVLAALLHAAYSHGEFGDGRRGATTRKRAVLQDTIGIDAEGIVDTYTRTPWGPATVAEYARRGRTLQAPDHDVAILRIANDAEDHLELGMLYCAARVPVPLADDAALAENLGHRPLAALIRTLEHEEHQAGSVAPSVRVEKDAAYLVAPLSYRPRVRVHLDSSARRARHALASLPVVGPIARRVRLAVRRHCGTRHRSRDAG